MLKNPYKTKNKTKRKKLIKGNSIAFNIYFGIDYFISWSILIKVKITSSQKKFFFLLNIKIIIINIQQQQQIPRRRHESKNSKIFFVRKKK